jgi:4-hydroxythreonine-4-phosphate dehydrogenase
MPLALTMGEPAGIGGEIALRAWVQRKRGARPFFVIDDIARLEALARRFAIPCPLAPIATAAEALPVFTRALPVMALPEPLAVPSEPGRLEVRNGRAVIGAIDRAVALAQRGDVAAVVTNPIHKATLTQSGFAFPGHTEYLGHLAGGAKTVMMLAIAELRVIPVTVHIALKNVASSLSTERIIACGRIVAHSLARDFGIDRPRLAVTGLNPQAGEQGTMGDEEMRIIAPAVRVLQAEGIDARGPAPADTLFHEKARAGYDAALCMYHDQALIPLKTLDFANGVNVTLGLPFVRTSPDHGTALDIAAKGIADPASLIAALALADRIAATRQQGLARQSA